jgi:hypothetical protein
MSPGHNAAEIQSGAARESRRLVRHGRPLRIVIAEDEAVLAMEMQGIIQEAGGEVSGIPLRAQDGSRSR